jgi:hypothetical protein
LKKKILKLSLLSITVLLIQGCATHSNFVKKYNTLVGQNINSFIATKGYPDSTYVLPNKNKVYVYERSRIYSMPSMMSMVGYGYGGYYGGYGYGFGYGNDIVQESCKLFLETNKKGMIIKWSSCGNHCVSN